MAKTGYLTIVILSLLIGQICCENAHLTLPIYHPSSLQEEEQKIKKEHNCSYHTYHNSRNQPKQHLRHDLSVSNNTYGIISMGYYFTLPMLVAGYAYNLNVDTGSSDIFIKGQGTQGKPKFKYSCSSCLAAS